MTPAFYPIVLEPILKEKVWGGRRLERYGKRLPRGVKVGESWELADLPSTSPSGGGGGEARSVVANGSLAGRTLHEAMELWGEGLLGEVPPTPEGDFPLLLKLLDAEQNLSVQVHPSTEWAEAHPEAHLKTECWYVLEAETDSVIFKGLKVRSSKSDLSRAVREKTVADLLDAVPAEPGDCHELPSGTVHALGAGVMVAEVQTPSDTTYRLYDWSKEYRRSGRPVHVREALECARIEPPRPPTRSSPGVAETLLVRTPFFEVRELQWGERDRRAQLPGIGACLCLMVLSGDVGIASRGGGFDSVHLRKGTTAVLPAAIRADVHLWAGEAGRLLAVTPRG